jgi:hypothetical protein
VNPRQIQAVLTGLLAAFLAWRVIATLMKGEVTVSLNGRGVKRSEDARGYWSWTLIMIALLAIVAAAFLAALLHR